MSRKVTRNKPLRQSKIDFYCYLNWKGKSTRLRKKSKKIILNDFMITDGKEMEKEKEFHEYGGYCFKCRTYYAECGCL